MTTTTWVIERLDCIPQTEAGQQNYVIVAYWRCNGEAEGFSGMVYGSCGFTVEQGPVFVPYEDLTEAQVLGWVWASGVDKDVTEAVVEGQIEAQKNPPIVSLPLPWQS